MKTKFFNYLLLVFAAIFLVTAVVAFVNGDIICGICNILWMGCEVLLFLVNKKSIEVKHRITQFCVFLSVMNDTIEEYGSAIITEDKNGQWRITAGGRNIPSCSAENNDQIAFGNNSNVGDKK